MKVSFIQHMFIYTVLFIYFEQFFYKSKTLHFITSVKNRMLHQKPPWLWSLADYHGRL